MPYVNVRIAGEATAEQKQELIHGISEVLANVLGKPPSATYVVIDEVSPDNWGHKGESLTRLRKKAER